jgi:hypothetical protein
VLLFAALTRVHAGFGELCPPRCTPKIIEQLHFGGACVSPRRAAVTRLWPLRLREFVNSKR